jgi:hypothetical protein
MPQYKYLHRRYGNLGIWEYLRCMKKYIAIQAGLALIPRLTRHWLEDLGRLL